VASVVDKFIIKLEAQLEPKKVVLVVSDAARRWLADKGYDRLMGARPMERVIQEHIKKPLADAILFGELSQGGRVEVSADATGLVLEMHGLETEPA
jgi:ATP-dependent Clp protease ATP-binding subunit ClpA